MKERHEVPVWAQGAWDQLNKQPSAQELAERQAAIREARTLREQLAIAPLTTVRLIRSLRRTWR